MQFTIFLATIFSVLTTSLVQANGDQRAHDQKAHDQKTHEVRTIEGWTLHVNRSLVKSQPEKTKVAMELLTEQLQRVVKSVPAKAVSALRTVPIWMNPQYTGTRPGAAYHPSKRWLTRNKRNPAMAKAIEITNVSIFEAENRRMPDLILHELAHAYHDQVLGFENEAIQDAFRLAQKSGTYDSVKRFTGRKTTTDKAYAMTNHKEYFAETTEAYFGQNDFYPFNLQELQAHDPQMVIVLKRCWGITK